jgi:hypothetical protein
MDRRIVYPIGDSDFAGIRRNGMFYVDKTRYVYELVTGGKYYFLSRPRRFGKSMLVSTLEAYFRGEKQLFDGLEIASLESDWHSYPVLRLDLSTDNMSRHEGLEAILQADISAWEKLYGKEPEETSIAMRFRGIIRRAALQSGKGVVVLVDEYDNALFSTLDDKEQHEKMRGTLKGVYSVLKSESANIRFCFLTGITRFNRMSVFSGLNNLQDITLNRRFAGICGISADELQEVCRDGITKVAEINGFSYEEASRRLKDMYDGYHFGDLAVDVYNPFSLLQAFDEGELKSYWFSSGTSEFLWKRMASLSETQPLKDLLSPMMRETELTINDSEGFSLEALLFQTGYLTIKGKNTSGSAYILGIPNQEVRDGIMHGLLPIASSLSQSTLNRDIDKLQEYANNGDVDKFINHLKRFLASISYTLTKKQPEIFYENNLFIIFNLIGLDTQVETETSDGRIDVVIRCNRFIYIIELKLDKTAEDALLQIEQKHYQLPYLRFGLPIYLIGINFSSATRTIQDYAVTRVDPVKHRGCGR